MANYVPDWPGLFEWWGWLAADVAPAVLAGAVLAGVLLGSVLVVLGLAKSSV